MYDINGVELEHVDSFSYLGVVICNNLHWKDHISGIIRNKTISGMIKRTIGYHAPSAVKLSLYKIIVRSIVEYASPFWSPYYSRQCVRSLESLQRSFSRHIVNYEQCPYEERCVNLCLLPLSYRREMHDVTLVFKMMRVFNWCDISHYVIVYDDSGRLRVNQASAAGVLLKPRRTRTETYHSSFFIRIIDIWNNLPPTSRNCTSQRSFEKHIEMFDQEKLLAFSTDDMCSWLSFCRCESCKCTKLNVLNSV